MNTTYPYQELITFDEAMAGSISYLADATEEAAEPAHNEVLALEAYHPGHCAKALCSPRLPARRPDR